MREKADILERPLIIWEPSPLFCNPENLEEFLKAASFVDVFSPNHPELARTFSLPLYPESTRESIVNLAERVLERGVGPDRQGVVIIRAGELGCYVAGHGCVPEWLPPYHEYAGRISKVVDPTGAGNAFLGAYAIGYLKTRSVKKAACYGSVGASFAIEQVGIPEMRVDNGEEVWNGQSAALRLHEYMSRAL